MDPIKESLYRDKQLFPFCKERVVAAGTAVQSASTLDRNSMSQGRKDDWLAVNVDQP